MTHHIPQRYPNGTATSIHWDEFNSKGYLAKSTATGKPENFWRYATPTGNAVVDSSNPAAMKAVTDAWYVKWKMEILKNLTSWRTR